MHVEQSSPKGYKPPHLAQSCTLYIHHPLFRTFRLAKQLDPDFSAVLLRLKDLPENPMLPKLVRQTGHGAEHPHRLLPIPVRRQHGGMHISGNVQCPQSSTVASIRDTHGISGSGSV